MAVVTMPMGSDIRVRLPRPSGVWWGALVGVVALTAVVTTFGRASTSTTPPATVTHAVPVAEPDYPYDSTTRVGPWGFTTRHAADYVAWRFFQRDVTFHATMGGPKPAAGRFGDPAGWAAHATTIGFRVDAVPHAGVPLGDGAGEQGAGGAGHVAYVERVNPDGSVVVAEFDWSVPNGLSRRDAVRAPRYIHVQDL
jgi:surface antigen